eukprot:783698_1
MATEISPFVSNSGMSKTHISPNVSNSDISKTNISEHAELVGKEILPVASTSELRTTSKDAKKTDGPETKKFTLLQATALNTLNMFGTGPFITIPFVIAAANPPGPHALIGYGIACFVCFLDSLIW